MRARRREINIFNMSLLDILCGALGAFCFMMLVLFPYYKPGRGGAQLREDQEKTQELMREIEKLRDQLTEPGAAQNLEELLRRLQAQIQSLQGQINQLTAENDKLNETNEKQKRLLSQKKPFFVVSAGEQHQALDLYLQDDETAEGSNKSANPPFNPTTAWHLSHWENDLKADFPGLGMNIWLTSSATQNSHFKVYLKLANEPQARKAIDVSSAIYGDLGTKTVLLLPTVTLTPERFWTFVGTIVVDDNHKLTFIAATPEQREAEWKAIAKTSPPPIVTPTPAPTGKGATAPLASPSGTASDQRREMLEKLRKEQEQRQQSSPQKSIEEQRREMLEKLQKERQQQVAPSQTPDLERRQNRVEKWPEDRQSPAISSPLPMP
jgi:hypothetical protein